MELTETVATDEIERRLNAVMTEGVSVCCARKVEDGKASTAMALVAAADYLVWFRQGKEPSVSWQEKLGEFISQKEIIVTKKTKRSEKTVDIRPYIYQMEAREGGVFLKLASASSNYTKPELVMEAFYRHQGLTFGEFDWMTHRMELYADQGTEEERKLVPLEELGDEL